MPVYCVEISREVYRNDLFTRCILAPTKEAAMDIGDRLAAEADKECPGDTVDGELNYDLWSVQDAALATEADVEWAGEDGLILE